MTRGRHSRRVFLKGSGALVVSLSIGGSAGSLVGQTTAGQTLPVPGDQLDSWIAHRGERSRHRLHRQVRAGAGAHDHASW